MKPSKTLTWQWDQLMCTCIYYKCNNLGFPTFLMFDFYAMNSGIKTHHYSELFGQWNDHQIFAHIGHVMTGAGAC